MKLKQTFLELRELDVIR